MSDFNCVGNIFDRIITLDDLKNHKLKHYQDDCLPQHQEFLFEMSKVMQSGWILSMISKDVFKKDLKKHHFCLHKQEILKPGQSLVFHWSGLNLL